MRRRSAPIVAGARHPRRTTAPSDLERSYTAGVARGEKLPITFTVGTHPLDFVAATMRHPGDDHDPNSGL